MSEVVLKADKRTVKNKRANAQLRADGMIPAVIYGKDEENMDVSVDVKDFLRLVNSGHRMLKLDVEGSKKDVIVKEIQYGTYDHIILHADFRAVNENTIVHISVALVFDGSAKGVAEGGVVDHELHDLSIECKAKDVINEITVDISGLEVGENITVADLKVPEGIKIVSDSHAVVASCHMPIEESEEEEAGEEGAEEASNEPEVIGKKKEEEEE